MTLKQRHEGGPVAGYMAISRKGIRGRGTGQCKGPEAGTCLVCRRSSWEAREAEAESGGGGV